MFHDGVNEESFRGYQHLKVEIENVIAFYHAGTLLQACTATLNVITHQLTELNIFIFQVLAYSVACSCVSAFSVNIIEAHEAEEAMNKLRTLVENNQQVIV